MPPPYGAASRILTGGFVGCAWSHAVDARKGFLGKKAPGRGFFTLSPKPTLFRWLRLTVAFRYMCRNIHENCVLADFLNLIPRDSQFGSPSKSKFTAFSGDEYCCDASITQINFIVADVPQLSAVANANYNFIAQAVGVASHSADRSFPVFL